MAQVTISTGVNESGIMGDELKVYPNSVNDVLTIEGKITKGEILIISVLVETTLKSEIKKPKTVIDINELPNGIYFVKVQNKKIKLIKQ